MALLQDLRNYLFRNKTNLPVELDISHNGTEIEDEMEGPISVDDDANDLMATSEGLAATPLELVLYEVDAHDPTVFVTIMVTLAFTGLLASFIPARRVAKVDPATALHSE